MIPHFTDEGGACRMERRRDFPRDIGLGGGEAKILVPVSPAAEPQLLSPGLGLHRGGPRREVATGALSFVGFRRCSDYLCGVVEGSGVRRCFRLGFRKVGGRHRAVGVIQIGGQGKGPHWAVRSQRSQRDPRGQVGQAAGCESREQKGGEAGSKDLGVVRM